jgi:hypothetical protein
MGRVSPECSTHFVLCQVKRKKLHKIMTVHLKILIDDVSRWYMPAGITGAPETWGKPLDAAQLAEAVTAMHGYPQPVTEEMILDLEDPTSTKKYPRVMLDEIMLFLSRCASLYGSRNIEVEDIAGLAARVES